MATVAEIIITEAQAQGVNPTVALAVAQQESGLNENAVSPAGAIGVFQLMPATAAELGVNPYDVTQNIQGGIKYLKQQIATFGSVPLGLTAYNWGPGNLSNAIQSYGSNFASQIPAETQNYISNIISSIGKYATGGIQAALPSPNSEFLVVLAGVIAAVSIAALIAPGK